VGFSVGSWYLHEESDKFDEGVADDKRVDSTPGSRKQLLTKLFRVQDI
jgi:hypothetical protein